MNYYIGDLHFSHKNVTNEGSNFDNRPFATLEDGPMSRFSTS